jgi:murein DD-endopeptidase MepM/ murein hydrolase activator NlpD
MPVYAIQSGEVLYAGSAQGYGGPDPCGWLVIDSEDSDGGGVYEYGHIRRLSNVKIGSRVVAGQQIAVVNPDRNTNGGTDAHLHLSYMPGGYNPASSKTRCLF